MDKITESIFTISSLYVLIRQHFNALIVHEKYFESLIGQIEEELEDETWVIQDTIYEALVHQIIIKSCSFVEEWNEVFTPKNLSERSADVLWVKKSAKPAIDVINRWEDLRIYRNEAIAHNHRTKNGVNIYLTKKKYKTPHSINEIGLIVFCLEKCFDVMRFAFFKEFQTRLTPQDEPEDIVQENFSNAQIKSIMDAIEMKVSESFLARLKSEQEDLST